jgi:sialic acid synthase SpsE
MNIPSITLQTGRIIGKGHPTYVIAEIGSNHDGDLERAKMLLHAAKEAGADAAKFQSFQVANLINTNYKKNNRWEPDPAWKILETLSLPKEWHSILSEEATKAGIDFISTPFDIDRLQLLLDLDVPAIKIASGDLTYHELLRIAGKSGKPVFLSTGHAILSEVEAALKVLWETGCKDIVLLHCASIYPADFGDANISAIVFMQQGFQVQVGYSDHTPGTTVPLGAVTLGACVIEKHFTDSKSRPGPDHAFAMEVEEFALMVRQIRQLEAALQGGQKTFRPGEEEERIIARRAIYAKERIPRGTTINRDVVKIVRHAYLEGIPANGWDRLLGKIAEKDIEKDEMITWEMIRSFYAYYSAY